MAEKAQAVFAELDTEGSGKLHFNDFQRYLSDFGFEDSEIESLFNRIDIDSSGHIDLSEFVHGYKLWQRARGESFSDDWKLWNQLDQRDEEDKLKLSKLFSVLEKMQSAAGASGEVTNLWLVGRLSSLWARGRAVRCTVRAWILRSSATTTV